MTEFKICWNQKKTIGVIVHEDDDRLGLTYELRKGALNTLGVVTPAFMEAWGDMTADDNCTVETVALGSTTLELTEWERDKLSWHASSNAMTYMGHHERGRNGKSGLFPHEIEEMERWKALSDKLKAPKAGG